MYRHKVVLAQTRLVHYRVDLFETMRVLADRQGIDFHLLHGQPSDRERRKRDEGRIDWAHRVANRYWPVGATDVLWQPIPRPLRRPDLFIVDHGNRILSNYPLLMRRSLGGPLVAFWGHGANLQSQAPNGLRERWKRWLINRVDYWFAYTQKSFDILQSAGFDTDRITVLNNSIDTSQFRAECAAVTPADVAAVRTALGIPAGARVGLFCGSLYLEKRLDLMVAAADIVRARIPEFHLVVVGNGPAEDYLVDACRTRPWLHMVGVKFGSEKAAHFRAGDVMFNPGALGLHILDAFCAGIPIVSTHKALHGPEISYLEHGVNGLLTEDTPERYAQAVLDIVENRAFAAELARNGLHASGVYTLPAMAERFVAGICRCLALGQRQGGHHGLGAPHSARS
jgi:glycosyltransferase involved in cell wall biosynthesis